MASSSQHTQHVENLSDENNKDFALYLPLYKAAFEGDWKAAEIFFEKDSSAMTVGISGSSKTALHIAAISGQTSFVEELVEKMPAEALEHTDTSGHTALYFAVVAGNIKAAKAMVNKNPKLPEIRNKLGNTPIYEAALLGHKDLLRYLCYETEYEDLSPFRGKDGLRLLNAVMAADFYDVALYLIDRYPELATTSYGNGNSALDFLARRPSAFRSGSELGFLQNCIYPMVHVQEKSTSNHKRRGDIEDPETQNSKDSTEIVSPFRFLQLLSQIIHVLQWFNGLFWNAAKYLVPGVKEVYDTKLMNAQAIKLVKCICDEVSRLDNHSKITKLINIPFLVAAEYGAIDFITICFQIFPQLIWVHSNSCTILHIAIQHRQENVFNFVQKMSACTNTLASYNAPGWNNILHLAAKLAPSPKLKAVSGTALQMQRELQWFKAVEKITRPTYKDLQNSDQKTPRVLFTEEHKDLVEKGEKWMRDMASSCSLVATLIATVVFAAAFTVPGGNNNDSGIPIFQKNRYFMLFAVSDAIGLISSLTSVLIFLSILSSRYAEEDFLVSLPRKLVIGLSTLFMSIAATATAFSSAYLIMFGHQFEWVAILVTSLACFPAVLFALLQLPLFVELVRSTYDNGILY